MPARCVVAFCGWLVISCVQNVGQAADLSDTRETCDDEVAAMQKTVLDENSVETDHQLMEMTVDAEGVVNADGVLGEDDADVAIANEDADDFIDADDIVNADIVVNASNNEGAIALASIMKTIVTVIYDPDVQALMKNSAKLKDLKAHPAHLLTDKSLTPLKNKLLDAVKSHVSAKHGKAVDAVKKFLEFLTDPAIAPLVNHPSKLKKYLHHPMDFLGDKEMKPVRNKLLPFIIEPLQAAMDKVPSVKSALKQVGVRNAKDIEQFLAKLLNCAGTEGCGDCTNGLNPCYWCPRTNSCHPVGSQQMGFAKSDGAKCTTSSCQSQWPTSSCQSAYCPDGSSVGNDNGPCGGRLNCDACLKGKCFWCGISGSCHQIGSRFYDKRCTNSNCQSKSWYSSCHSGKCSAATKYQQGW